jgi:DoxX-like family
MFVAAAAVTVLLAALLVFSAIRKLSHREEVVQTYVRVGVPEDRLDRLAFVLLAAAAGLVIGLLWAPLGVAAGIGVVGYFAAAVVAHVRADDTKHLPAPVAYALIAMVALALRLAAL